MKSYHDLLTDVINNGVSHEDRTGVGTRCVFGRQWRHKMSDGFPLLTTKRVTLRWVFEELRWFLSGSTNNEDLLKEGVTIWNEWQDNYGELGPVYGKQWRNQETAYYVEKKFIPKPESQEIGRILDEIPCEASDDPLVGQTVSTLTGDFVVKSSYRIKRSEETNQSKQVYDVQFVRSGWISRGVTTQAVRGGYVRDPYFPSFCGVACTGGLQGVVNGEKHHLLETWKGMIKRCYDQDHTAYKSYGGNGVWVCDRWLVFENFVADFKKIIGWELKAEYPSEYSLDKDSEGYNIYSPQTCRWLSSTEQSINTDDAYLVKAVDPSGVEMSVVGIKRFCRDRNLTSQAVSDCIKGKLSHHKGWKFYAQETPSQCVARYRRTDQIAHVLAQVSQDPGSRRILVSAWNPLEIPNMSLAPCHVMWQLNVDNGVIDLHLYARSIDIFLGLPYNIASYGLLLKMICAVTGNEAGELVISFGNLHLYNNHVNQANEQLSREPRRLPNVHIYPEQKKNALETLLGIQWKDVELTGYNPHPKIEAEVAV